MSQAQVSKEIPRSVYEMSFMGQITCPYYQLLAIPAKFPNQNPGKHHNIPTASNTDMNKQ
jgi:hypothetical protein